MGEKNCPLAGRAFPESESWQLENKGERHAKDKRMKRTKGTKTTKGTFIDFWSLSSFSSP